VSGAPVIDRTGRPVGVFSISDVAFGWGRDEAERQRIFYRAATGQFLPIGSDEPSTFWERAVGEVMTPLLFTVQHDDEVQEAALRMTVEKIHRVVVLDGARIVGVLSASDVVAAVGRGELVEVP
jgi:CBS domain-containing protein